MASMLPSKFRSTLLLLSIMLVSLLSTLPSGIGQTSLTTLTSTSTYTLGSVNATTTYPSTVTSIITSTSSLTVNETTSIYSTYNSTSTVTTSETSTATANPPLDYNLILLVVNVLAGIFLIYAVIRFVKHRRK